MSEISQLFEAGIGWLISALGFERDVAVNLFTDIIVSFLLLSALAGVFRFTIQSVRRRLRSRRLKSILGSISKTASQAYGLVGIANDFGIIDTLEEPGRSRSDRQIRIHPGQADALLEQFMLGTSRYLRAHTEMYQLVDISSGQLEADDIDPISSFLAVSGTVRTDIEEARNRLDRLVVGLIGQGEIVTEKRTGIEGAQFAAIALARIRGTCEDVELPTEFASLAHLVRWHKHYQEIQREREHRHRRTSRF